MYQEWTTNRIDEKNSLPSSKDRAQTLSKLREENARKNMLYLMVRFLLIDYKFAEHCVTQLFDRPGFVNFLVPPSQVELIKSELKGLGLAVIESELSQLLPKYYAERNGGELYCLVEVCRPECVDIYSEHCKNYGAFIKSKSKVEQRIRQN